jgi:hypothetical protein
MSPYNSLVVDDLDSTSANDDLTGTVDLDRFRLDDANLAARCGDRLDADGALVLTGFFPPTMVRTVIDESLPRMDEAFFTTDTTHSVYLTPPDRSLPDDHVANQQVLSTKGCLAHDQVPLSSPLRTVYDSSLFQRFLCRVLGIDAIYPYADKVSGINVHFHLDGQELGWHFDNSSFAVTALMQAPDQGGVFQYVPGLRDADAGDMNYPGVDAILNPTADGADNGPAQPIHDLTFSPGDLVLFRGRNSMHRVTPSEGLTPRVLVVFAYNTEPGIGLSESAKQTFYGRSR